MTRTIIHLVADYGPYGDLAWNEVESVLYREGPENLQVIPTVVPKFNVTAASFAAYQLAQRVPHTHAARIIVFVNVDARTHTRARITNGDGEPLFVGIMGNNVRIIGAGLATFMVAQQCNEFSSMEKIHIAPRNGVLPGQFRSRDIFAPIVATIARGDDVTVKAITHEGIPSLLPCVLAIDGYGNIKTSLRRNDVRGKRVTIALNKKKFEVRVAKGLFDILPGELGIYPGSSGTEDDPFFEIAVRFDSEEKNEDSATRRFGYPAAGMQICVTILEDAKVPLGS